MTNSKFDVKHSNSSTLLQNCNLLAWYLLTVEVFCACRLRPQINTHLYPKYILKQWYSYVGECSSFFNNGENHTRLALIPRFNDCEFRMTSMVTLQMRGFPQGSKPGVHTPCSITTCFPVTESQLVLVIGQLEPVTFVYFLGSSSSRDCTQQQKYPGTYTVIFKRG